MDFEPQVISPTQSPPSAFVNILAWILILFGGFVACMAILRNIILSPFLTKKGMTGAMQQTEQIEEIPIMAKMMFSHNEYFFLFALVFSVVMLVVGIGLLKRKNWARIITIIMIALGIFSNIAVLVLLFTLFSEMTNLSGGEAIAVEIQKLIRFIQVFGAILVVACLALHIFIINKLCSLKIKEEFLKTKELVMGKSWG